MLGIPDGPADTGFYFETSSPNSLQLQYELRFLGSPLSLAVRTHRTDREGWPTRLLFYYILPEDDM